MLPKLAPMPLRSAQMFSGDREPLLTWAVLLLGCALRLTGLTVHSLWYDEGATIHVAVAESVVEALRGDRHPPLSFLLFREWAHLGGWGDAWLRLLPALMGCASLWLFRALAKRMLEPATALAALALFALSPFQLWHAQEVRMYSLLQLGALLAYVGVFTSGWRGLVCCASGGFIALGSHYMGGFVVPTSLALLAWKVRSNAAARPLRLWLPHGIALALGALAWLPWLVHMLPIQMATDWGYQLRSSPRDLIEFPIRQLLTDLDVLAPNLLALGYANGLIILIGIAVAAARALVRSDSPARGALLIAAGPLLCALAATLVLPGNLVPKYLIAAAPGVPLLVAHGLAKLPQRAVRYALAAFLMTGMVTLDGLHRVSNRREDYRSACAAVVEHWEPGDLVVVISGTPRGFSEATVRHYLRRSSPTAEPICDFKDLAGSPLPPGRMHVVFRAADYAKAQLDHLVSQRQTLDSREENFRIQWLLLGPK